MGYGLAFAFIVAGCLGASFLFSGMEAGVAALNRLRIRHRMRAGDPRAAVLHAFLENPENFLWTILVGNTLANFAAVSLLVMWLHDRLGHQRPWLFASLAVLVLLLYTLMELLPKMLFRAFPNRLCLLLARPFRAVHLALSPLVALIEHLSERLLRWTGGRAFKGRVFGNRDELRFAMQESGAQLSGEEVAMVNRVLDLQNLHVRDIALPMASVTTVDAAAPVQDIIRLCREHRIGRLPVWRPVDGGRKIVGLVQLNSILFAPDGATGRQAGELVQPAVFIEEDMRLEQALERLRRSGQRVAVVVDADGRECGLIGLRDILKFVFGDVPR